MIPTFRRDRSRSEENLDLDKGSSASQKYQDLLVKEYEKQMKKIKQNADRKKDDKNENSLLKSSIHPLRYSFS